MRTGGSQFQGAGTLTSKPSATVETGQSEKTNGMLILLPAWVTGRYRKESSALCISFVDPRSLAPGNGSRSGVAAQREGPISHMRPYAAN